MESGLEVIDGLIALGYEGKFSKLIDLGRALDMGLRSEEFRDVVVWLSTELHVLRKTDEKVSADVNDTNELTMELSAMLKELGCPYTRLVTGPLSERFGTREAHRELLDYLVAELMATKMCLHRRPDEQAAYIIPKLETHTARSLEQMMSDLGLAKPAENITPRALFDKLNFKVEEQQRLAKPGVLSEPLLHTPTPLTDEQWSQLETIQADLDAEYNLRRKMLLTRLEVTIHSFQWADKMKMHENEIGQRFRQKLAELEPLRIGGEDTNIVALLAARADQAVLEKTSSAKVLKNTATQIQKHVIGSVPDRGGRANEHAPPPPEMPSWQTQRASGPSGGGGGRGGGGGGGRGRGNFQGRGGGGRGGGGRGGAGGWMQQEPQQFNQRPQFEQGRDQSWMSGSGRVQGSGWTPKGNDYIGQGGGSGGNNSGYHQGDRGGRGSYRGKSNYNRGGFNR